MMSLICVIHFGGPPQRCFMIACVELCVLCNFAWLPACLLACVAGVAALMSFSDASLCERCRAQGRFGCGSRSVSNANHVSFLSEEKGPGKRSRMSR